MEELHEPPSSSSMSEANAGRCIQGEKGPNKKVKKRKLEYKCPSAKRLRHTPESGKPLESLSELELMEEVDRLVIRCCDSNRDHTWMKLADVLDAVKTRHITRIRQDWHQDAPYTADSSPETSKSRHVHKRQHEHLNYLSCRAFDSVAECMGDKEDHFCCRLQNSIVVELAVYRDDNRMEHGLRGEEAHSYGVYFGKDSKWNLSHHAEGYRTLSCVLKEATIAAMNQILDGLMMEEGDPFNKETMRSVTFRIPSESFAKKAKKKIDNARVKRWHESKRRSFARRDEWFDLIRIANSLKDNGVEVVFWPLIYPTKHNHAYHLAVEACGGEALWRKNPFLRSRRRNGTYVDKNMQLAKAEESTSEAAGDSTDDSYE